MSRWIWFVLIGAGLWYLARKPLAEWEASKRAGVTAAIDATVLNGYTTYNTQLYKPPAWAPIVNFFKAGAYVPAPGGNSGSSGSSGAAYSMQG